MNILINDSIIDFHIDKKKFESYKTENGKKRFVLCRLAEIFESLKGKVIGNITLRDVSITSNNFWGEDYVEINDLGYSFANQVKKNKKHTTLRVFAVYIISVFDKEIDAKDQFLTIEDKDFLIESCSAKIV